MIDFNNRDELEDYFKQLFKKLKKIYNIEMNGYYNIKVYMDKYYGVVLEIVKEEFQYYDYLDNQVDMRINLIDTNFLYEVNDVPVNLLDKIDIYKYDQHLYIVIKKELPIKDMDRLMEFGRLVYNGDCLENKLVLIDKCY